MKPGDFFLGVVNFLGVLVPGAALLLLRGPSLQGWHLTAGPVPPWLIFSGAAYLAGQFLLAVTEALNSMAAGAAKQISRTLHNDIAAFRHEASERLELIRIGSPGSKFHTALSYLRTRNAAAAAELDHHMADYKLLRNLFAVLVIDLLIRASTTPQESSILILEGVLVVVC